MLNKIRMWVARLMGWRVEAIQEKWSRLYDFRMKQQEKELDSLFSLLEENQRLLSPYLYTRSDPERENVVAKYLAATVDAPDESRPLTEKELQLVNDLRSKRKDWARWHEYTSNRDRAIRDQENN